MASLNNIWQLAIVLLCTISSTTVMKSKCIYHIGIDKTILKIHEAARDVPTVVGTDHHSDKITTTTNSLTSTKYQHDLVLLATLRKTKRLHTRDHRQNWSTYSLRFRDFKSPLCKHHSLKPGHIPGWWKLIKVGELLGY